MESLISHFLVEARDFKIQLAQNAHRTIESLFASDQPDNNSHRIAGS